jgi:hypothetical protein
MSPRQAGLLVIAASVIAGVGAGWVMSDSRWSLLAAFVLTASTIGMGVGILWTMRASWEDMTWPPGGVVRSEAERVRRSYRILGIMLVTPVPVFLALLVWGVVSVGITPTYRALMIVAAVVYGAAGVVLLIAGRARPEAPPSLPSHHEPPSRGDEAVLPDGWQPLGPRASRWIMAATLGPFAFVVALAPLQLMTVFRDFAWAPAVMGLMFAAMIGIYVVVINRAAPRVHVHLRDERIRAGSREARWDEVTAAELLATPRHEGEPRTLVLTLQNQDGLRAPLVIRRREDLALTKAEAAIAARLIEASVIELPRDKDDPRGKFSRQLYPAHLTKSEALDVVASPPTMSDPLPTRG